MLTHTEMKVGINKCRDSITICKVNKNYLVHQLCSIRRKNNGSSECWANLSLCDDKTTTSKDLQILRQLCSSPYWGATWTNQVMLLLQLEICNGSPFSASKRAVFTNPCSACLHLDPFPTTLPFAQPVPATVALMLVRNWAHPIQGLRTDASLCLLGFSSKCWHDPLSNPLKTFLQMSFSQEGFPWPLSFKLPITLSPSKFYLLYRTYHPLPYYTLYSLCMYLFLQPSLPPHISSMSKRIFKSWVHCPTPQIEVGAWHMA